MDCPHCGRRTDMGASFCTNCGQRLVNANGENAVPSPNAQGQSGLVEEAPMLSCPRCGAASALESTHCGQCGAVLRADLRVVDAYRPETPPVESGVSYSVPQSRVLVFTVLSFGLYLFYWMYLTWRQYRDNVRNAQSPGREPGPTLYPVWHALTLLVPIYGLYRTHAHMTALRNMMNTRGLTSSISPGWCVAAVLPITFRTTVSGYILLALLIGADVAQSAESVPAETLSRGELVLALAIEVLVLAAVTWMLVHVQSNLNAYWSRAGGPVETVPLSIVELALVFLGVAAWVFTISGIASAV